MNSWLRWSPKPRRTSRLPPLTGGPAGWEQDELFMKEWPMLNAVDLSIDCLEEHPPEPPC